MANRFWVGGTASWDSTAGSKWATTSGGGGGSAVPTASDDVFFDGASGAVTVTKTTASVVCRSLNFTGFTGTFTHNASVTLSIGDGTAGASNIALKLVSGMTYTLGSTTTSAFSFISTSGTQQTIDFGGKTCGNLTINGAGSSYLLNSAITNAVTATFTHTAGTFNSNGFNPSTGKYVTASGTKTLTLGSTTWTCTGTGTVWDFATSAPTFNANTSTIIVNDTSSSTKTFAGGGKTFNVVTFSGDNITVSGANTFDTLNVNNAGLTNGLKFTISVTQTISTSMTTNGSTGSTCIIKSTSSGTVATISKSSGTVTLNYANIRDITATGGATWIASNGIFTSNNTGIFFESTAKAAGGNWSATGTWLNATVPTNNYTILLDSTSGNVTLDSAPIASSLDCTGYTGTLTNTAGLTLSGALANRNGRVLKLVAGMTYSGAGAITVSKTQAAQETLDFGGKTTAAITFSGSGGSWKFNDAMSGTTFTQSNGTVNTNDKAVTTTGSFSLSAGITTLGNSALTVGSLTISGTGASTFTSLTVTGGTGTITLSTSGTVAFGTTGFTTNGGIAISNATVTWSTATVNCTTFSVSSGSLTVTSLTLTASSTFTLSGGTASMGTSAVACSACTLSGATVTWGVGSINCITTSLSHSSGSVIFTNVTVTTVTSITISGGTTSLGSSQITCGTSFNASGSSITAGTSLISCNSLSSTTSLTLYDLSIISSGSIPSSLSTNHTISHNLTMTGANATTGRIYQGSSVRGTARTLTCNGTVSINNAILEDITGAGSASWDMSANQVGDADGNSGITFTPAATQAWSGTSGGNWSANAWTTRMPLPQDNVVINQAFSAQTITHDFTWIGRNLDFTGSTGLTFSGSTGPFGYGNLTLASGMSMSASGGTNYTFRGRRTCTITTNGVILTNGYIGCDTLTGTVLLGDNLQYTSSIGNNRLASGTLDLNGFNYTTDIAFATTTGTTLLLRGGTLTISSDTAGQTVAFAAGTVTAGASTVIQSGVNSTSSTFQGNGNTFNNATISHDNVTMSGNNTFNTIAINQAGNTNGLKLTQGTTQTVTNITTNGSAGNLAKLVSTVGGSPATISCASGTISVDYMSIKDSTATGGAAFYAGANSTNVSGNTGWTFTAPPDANSVAWDATSNSGAQVFATSYSWNVTCNGSNRYLTVGVSIYSATATVSSIVRDSQSMTLLGAKTQGSYRSELWGLSNPNSGTKSCLVTLDTDFLDSAATANSFTNVDQTTGTESFVSAGATNGASDDPATVDSTTVVSGDIVVDCLTTGSFSPVVGSGQTQESNIGDAIGCSGSSIEGPKSPAGSVTMSWTGIGMFGTWAIAAVGLRPVPSAVTYTATAGFSVGGKALAASATFSPPVYTATLAGTLGGKSLSASATFVAPVYTGTMAATVGGKTVSSTATFAAPTYSGSSSLTLGAVTESGTVTYTVLTFAGSSALTINGPDLSAIATFVTPVYSSSASLMANTDFASTATFVTPVYSATGSLVAGHRTVSGSATFIPPVYAGTAAFVINTDFSSFAAFVAPVYSASMAKTLGAKAFAAAGVVTPPTYAGTSALSVNAPDFSASAQHVTPTYSATAAFTVNTDFVGSAQFLPGTKTATSSVTVGVLTVVATGTVLAPVYHGTANLVRSSSQLAGTVLYAYARDAAFFAYQSYVAGIGIEETYTAGTRAQKSFASGALQGTYVQGAAASRGYVGNLVGIGG